MASVPTPLLEVFPFGYPTWDLLIEDGHDGPRHDVSVELNLCIQELIKPCRIRELVVIEERDRSGVARVRHRAVSGERDASLWFDVVDDRPSPIVAQTLDDRASRAVTIIVNHDDADRDITTLHELEIRKAIKAALQPVRPEERDDTNSHLNRPLSVGPIRHDVPPCARHGAEWIARILAL
jgi:hypothetical protein